MKHIDPSIFLRRGVLGVFFHAEFKAIGSTIVEHSNIHASYILILLMLYTVAPLSPNKLYLHLTIETLTNFYCKLRLAIIATTFL